MKIARQLTSWNGETRQVQRNSGDGQICRRGNGFENRHCTQALMEGNEDVKDIGNDWLQ